MKHYAGLDVSVEDTSICIVVVGAGRFEARVKDLIEALPDLGEVFSVLLAARQKLREAFSQLHRKVLGIVRDNAVCMRLMTIPGVGPVTSLAFISTVDIPTRSRSSRAVGPVLGTDTDAQTIG